MSAAAVSAPPRAVQDRSKRTHRQILEAGTQLLEGGGPEGLTVASVAKRAGVATGSVYRRFGNKDHLLIMIQREFTSRFVSDFKARMAAADVATHPPSVIVEAAVTGLASTFEAHADLLRVFIYVGTTNEAVVEVGAQAALECGREFRAVIGQVGHAVCRPDYLTALDFSYRLVYGACEHRVIHPDQFESQSSLSWRDFAREMAATISLYLFGELAAPA